MNKILVVEDEKDILDMLKTMLTANGFEVFSALSGEEGLEKAVSLGPDLIFLDLMMPGLSGLEVCRLLKSKKSTNSIPIVVITALSREIDKEYAMEAGADDYILKPFTVEDIIKTLDKHLL
jgi:DNA-binding response OmpR family regulator